jgi:hypothetical protein
MKNITILILVLALVAIVLFSVGCSATLVNTTNVVTEIAEETKHVKSN